jgi:hypothetical protein
MENDINENNLYNSPILKICNGCEKKRKLITMNVGMMDLNLKKSRWIKKMIM